MAAIQFAGIENVVEAFINRDCPAFSIWQGRQFLFPYNGESTEEAASVLRNYLDTLYQQSTNHPYTIKVYEDLKPGERIKEKTPADGSFNFWLSERGAPAPGGMGVIAGEGSSWISKRLTAIEAQLMAKDDTPEETPLEKVAGFVENNSWTHPIIIGLAEKYLGYKLPENSLPTSLAGVTNDDKQITAAIEALKKRTPKLGEYLTKLANMDAATFNYLTSLLDKM